MLLLDHHMDTQKVGQETFTINVIDDGFTVLSCTWQNIGGMWRQPLLTVDIELMLMADDAKPIYEDILAKATPADIVTKLLRKEYPNVGRA